MDIKIDESLYNKPLKNLTAKKLLEFKNIMNLNDYLENNFKYVEENKYNLYIVSTNDTPKFSYPNMNSYNVFNAIKLWVDNLIIKPNSKNISFNQLLNNYIIAYGDFNFLKQKQKELLIIFNKILIPIYDTDYLYFNYNNDYILYPNFYETNWRPINNNQYNQIIENIIFLIFDILVILYPNNWNYLDNNFLYNYIYNDIDSKTYIINNNKLSRKEIIKTYLYQTWLILMNDDNLINFFNQYNTTTTIIYPNISSVNNNKYWTNNRNNIVIFLNEYINKNYIINNKDYKNIDIFNNIQNNIFFNYNISSNIDDNNKTTIIISIIAFIILSISIIIYLYFKKKNNIIYNQNPFKIIIGD